MKTLIASAELRRSATGKIVYRLNGKRREWSIGCMAWETPEALRRHLAIFIPKAKFISGTITPDP